MLQLNPTYTGLISNLVSSKAPLLHLTSVEISRYNLHFKLGAKPEVWFVAAATEGQSSVSAPTAGAKSPSVSASTSTSQALSQDGVQSLALQWGFGLDLGTFRTSPSRAQTHDGYETFLVQNIDTSAGSRRATQDLDSSAPLHSASVGHPDDGIETSTNQNATGSMGSKKGRGVAKGWKLDKQVKKHGKYKIVFRPGLKYSTEHESEFADGLCIVIKTNAEIQGQWFDIEGWSTDDRVHMIVDYRLQTAYTRWRNTLRKVYKKLVDEGISPREVCPREDLSMTKWQAACDFIEDEKFQKKSRINSLNRSKKQYDHTSGKTAMITCYNKMVKKSRILLWRDTHVSKKNGGRFVNSTAQSLHHFQHAETNLEQQIQHATILADLNMLNLLLKHCCGSSMEDSLF
ncbi:hypothetical protein BUALT_Bualt11G0032400 [Buddleja alternifolia]|uniref:Uncharacterized protein n=1 Tax=Buddleja alternifolia TaxID=168488 RepID=A0AAV6X0P5_9LAMI|nr:hypothetical protein BUALT_Bualt11G0032400 [Buddleja alternifolia]